jgi:hypothetical protein
MPRDTFLRVVNVIVLASGAILLGQSLLAAARAA